ncbi:hypothetical protein EM595_2019 [Duffyella gerundensis]|uniref:Uncharacterized protein n=1 Tax=Duffyella gerundensis TaxID=1619313 RepID=A0A0U5EAJ0_9GAMM|nr:hypothetical protein EM595_2019 [Duffyella gerundensis]
MSSASKRKADCAFRQESLRGSAAQAFERDQ